MGLLKKARTKFMSAALIVSMLVSIMPYQVFAEVPAAERGLPAAEQVAVQSDAAVTGKISVLLQLDYPQQIDAIAAQNIKVALLKDDGSSELLSVPVEKASYTREINGYNVQVTARGQDGVSLEMLPNPDLVYSYEIAVAGLAQDTYKAKLTGNGYKTFTSSEMKLKDRNLQLILGTSNATFTVGDVNQDGAVDSRDLALVVEKLGKTDTASLAQCDLNKDGVINVLDIAYVNHQMNASGEATIRETELILTDKITVDDTQFEIDGEGTFADIFEENTNPVTLKPTGDAKELEIPIEFTTPQEMAQVDIVSPAGDGAITSGVAVVEILTEDGKTEIMNCPFGESASAIALQSELDILYTEAATGTKTVTISLGKRVAVKKITIRVTKVENQETGKIEYAVVQQIKFLKDIVSEDTKPDNVRVENLRAVSGNESVSLSWNILPNVTGYEVKYGTQSGSYQNSLLVDTNQAVIKGLKNYETYYFIVIPCNNDWRGEISAEVFAIPEPSSKPSAPDMLSVMALDSGLQFGWQKAKNATYYKVYCRMNQEGEAFKLVTDMDADGNPDDGKITGTGKTVTGLTNGVEYELYVVAGNEVGESGKSKSVFGTPKKVVLEKPEGIPDNNLPSSIITKAVMKNSNNIATGLYPTGTKKEDVIKMVYDGDYSTGWAARAWWESSEFTFTLDKTYDMNYLLYVPRLDGKFRNSLDTYTIQVSATEFGDNFVTVGSGKVGNNPASTGFAILPFERSQVRRLKVGVAQWAGSPTNISLAEILFYEYDPDMDINGQVADLFADNAYSTLKADVTAEQIQALSAKLKVNSSFLINKAVLEDELKLASNLLKDGSGLGVMHYGITNVSGLQPLGVAAKANTKITIYADVPEGEKISIIATQFHAEAAKWKETVISELGPGRNELTIPQISQVGTNYGGSLYYEYSGGKGKEITLQVRGATDIPTLDLLDWYSMDETERYRRIDAYVAELKAFDKKGPDTVLNCTEIIMPNVLLSIPADTVKNALSNTDASKQLYQNTQAWEDLMHIAKQTHGIDATYKDSNPSVKRQNIRYMTMFAGAFMYAAGNHVGIGYGSCGGMVKGSPIDAATPGSSANHLYGWGIAHEIGHNLDLLGKAEITNNIYSLMVQTYDGKNNTLASRLESSNKYEQIRMKTAVGLPGTANDVFVQLGMYWQLHLAYDDGKDSANDPLHFYNQFAKNWKDNNNAANNLSYNDRVAVIASQTAGKNLTEFFTRWGMTLSGEATNMISSLPKENRAIWYFNDDARRYRLAGKSGDASIPSLTATVQGENSVHLAFESTGDVMGYEISRNGKVIAFTDKTEYVDTIGSANNLTFTYTVRAVDMSGNIGEEASEEKEIRISYNATVPEDKYDYKMENNTAVFTMKNNKEVPITGILIKNSTTSSAYTVTTSSAYTVTVTQQDGNTHLAKDGSYEDNLSTEANTFLTYFNKPGTGSSDPRMWTYDANQVEVTNVPDGAQVFLISYPGDNITFYEDGAFAGRLKADYKVSDEETLKEGTLVIIGNYRGNPVYNTIMVKGQFNNVNETDGEVTIEEREVSGSAYLFTEVPKDGAVSDTSDGFFLFVPDVQAEKELQGTDEIDNCANISILPAMIKAELYRTDTPLNENSTSYGRLVSDTLWYSSPADVDMPQIDLVK